MTIDRFANESNRKTKRFNSKYFCPQSEGVDAFNMSWKDENNFLVPPVSLIHKVINKIEHEPSTGVLIVPLWKSATFWALLKPKHKFKRYLKDNLVFESSCLNEGPSGFSILGREKYNGKMIAFRYDTRCF